MFYVDVRSVRPTVLGVRLYYLDNVHNLLLSRGPSSLYIHLGEKNRNTYESPADLSAYISLGSIFKSLLFGGKYIQTIN